VRLQIYRYFLSISIYVEIGWLGYLVNLLNLNSLLIYVIPHVDALKNFKDRSINILKKSLNKHPHPASMKKEKKEEKKEKKK
jgi:hypothetical protein